MLSYTTTQPYWPGCHELLLIVLRHTWPACESVGYTSQLLTFIAVHNNCAAASMAALISNALIAVG